MSKKGQRKRATREKLGRILKKLRLVDVALAVSRKRYERQHRRAVKNHRKANEAGERADRLRAEDHPKRAARKDNRAVRFGTRAKRLHDRSQVQVARIKRLVQRKHDLANTREKLEERLKELLQGDVKIEGNKVSGGRARERLKVCALAAAVACASGRRPNFYSQPGGWDVDHAITGERRGDRSDCSQWVTAVYKSCGLEDPNGNEFRGGYTGTLGTHGREIPREQLEPGDLILYGSRPFFHVEMYVGPGVKTIGHGSAPVDAGVVDLVPGPKQFRSYV